MEELLFQTLRSTSKLPIQSHALTGGKMAADYMNWLLEHDKSRINFANWMVQDLTLKQDLKVANKSAKAWGKAWVKFNNTLVPHTFSTTEDYRSYRILKIAMDVSNNIKCRNY